MRQKKNVAGLDFAAFPSSRPPLLFSLFFFFSLRRNLINATDKKQSDGKISLCDSSRRNLLSEIFLNDTSIFHSFFLAKFIFLIVSSVRKVLTGKQD